MADERDEERTEPATPRRRLEARERGQVARSADLSSAVVVLAGVLALRFLGGSLFGGISASAVSSLENLALVDDDPAGLLARAGSALAAIAAGFLPFLGIVLAVALGVGLAQTGFLFTAKPLAPDAGRLDPIAGFGRLFSARALARLVSGALKIAAVGLVVFWTIWAERLRLVELSGLAFEEILAVALEITTTLALRAALALLVLGLFEYGFQKWQHERDLRMSKQEIREEMRRYEGDPRVRERRRAVQQQLALQRMMLGVPEATVVVADPATVAVALRYEKTMEAPLVVAKGAGTLARRIRGSAMESGVPIVERKDLAGALYRAVDVGQPISPDLYQAAAEILAYVYRLKGRTAA